MPTGFMVAVFFVHASVPSSLEDSVANTEGKSKKGGQNERWPTSGRIGYITPAV